MNDIPLCFLGNVNSHPVGEYGAGELLVVGRNELKARRPGWNFVRLGDGTHHRVVDARGHPPFPAAFLSPSAVAGARIDRSEWPEADAPAVVPAGD